MKLSELMSPNWYFRIKEIKEKGKIEPYLGDLKKNKQYKDRHKGERCFILANGPSLNQLDFSKLAGEKTFTVNQIVRNNQFEKLKPTYHLWADRIFFEIDEENPEDLEMLEVIKAVNVKSPNTQVFYEVTAKNMIEKFGLNKISNINYFQSISLSSACMERGYIDFSRPVPNYPTVIDYAIILAVYMGFKDIYLLGCDCTGFMNIAQNKLKQAKDNLYAFEVTKNAAKRMERYAGQRSIKGELQSYVALFDEYENLDKYCSRHGAHLYNATEGGLLECLQRVDLDDVLKLF